MLHNINTNNKSKEEIRFRVLFNRDNGITNLLNLFITVGCLEYIHVYYRSDFLVHPTIIIKINFRYIFRF